MAKPTGADWGWIFGVGGVVALHNTIAAGRRTEMLCGAFRRHAKEHPIVTAAAVGWMVGHLYGIWPAWFDPLYGCGVGAERAVDLARRCQRPTPASAAGTPLDSRRTTRRGPRQR